MQPPGDSKSNTKSPIKTNKPIVVLHPNKWKNPCATKRGEKYYSAEI